MTIIGLLHTLFSFTTIFACAVLCLLPFKDRLKAPFGRLVLFAAILCAIPSVLMNILDPGFGFGEYDNLILFAFLPLFFILYKKYTGENTHKLLFIMCMCVHAASIIGAVFIAVWETVGESLSAQILSELAAILVLFVYYPCIGWLMMKFVIPRLLKLSAQHIKWLWVMPIAVAAVPDLFYFFAPYEESITSMFPIVYIPILVLSFAMYILILAMLDKVVEGSRADIEAERLREEAMSLERMNKMRSELMSTLSHEARTPLAVLSSYASLVAMNLKDEGVDAQTAEDLDKIVHEAKRVAELIDSFGKMELSHTGGNGKKRNVDAGEIARRTAELFHHLLLQGGITMSFDIADDLPPVTGSQEELTQIMFNLLQNARRHTDRDGSICVAAGREGDAHIKLSVHDTGSGITPELLPRIFERGVTSGGGMGLGLFICKDIVDSHGGEIGIESTVGQGTKVWFTLPVGEG